ncbi:CCA tRNA nucleotidyltransferase [Methanosarcinales archaeon]|nr:MAG: CCA tRNA nucleotidyltransferase [Methanosarcinales archaeon]
MLKEVLKKVKPDQAEVERLERFARFITDKIYSAAASLFIEIEVMLVGSAARGTWVSGEHDLDLFMLFEANQTRAELELNGIEIGKYVVKQDYSDEEFYCISYEKEYAEHPYIKAVFGDRMGGKYEVDIVPCFAVTDPAKIESAVDRTPFHNRYVLSKIAGLEDEVLLLKQFMRGIGVYGSELKRQGFSGYLTELLVIHYGSFLKVLKEAAYSWKAGMRIDIESHGKYEGADPLIVIDPVDPMRNVAAALSIENFGRFIDGAHRFLESPSIDLFFPKEPAPVEIDEFDEITFRRGTRFIFIAFDRPPVVEDILYPQLRRSATGATEILHREGFRVYRDAVWAGRHHAVILLELEVATLPAIKKHWGPPVWKRRHAAKFRSKHEGATYGIHIKDGRYLVDIERKYTDAKDFLGANLRKGTLGKNLKNADFTIIEGKKIFDLLEEEDFKVFLRTYFEPRFTT